MSREYDIKNLITNYTRRLQKLQEQQALEGTLVNPSILLEIEDIEAKVEKLHAQLKEMKDTKAKIEKLKTDLKEMEIEIEEDVGEIHQDDTTIVELNRSVPDLFIRNIFAILEENLQRDARMRELLSKPSPELCLLARTGFNYLHEQGRNYQAGFGEHLRSGTSIQVLLESPYSQWIETRRHASSSVRWDKLPPEQIHKLLRLYPDNLTIRFTENPVYCSLFFVYESVIYDPYHLGRRKPIDNFGNQFLVFEFQRPPQEKRYGSRDYYAMLKNHFDFLWNKETKTFEDLCAEHPEDLSHLKL